MDTPQPRKKLKNPLGDIAKAIDNVSPVRITPLHKSSKRSNVTQVTDFHDSYLTWSNYIASQDLYNKKSPLRSTISLKQILIAKNRITERNIGDLQIRERFESLLEELHGPYDGLQHTLDSLPATEARQLKTCNEKFVSFLESWKFNCNFEVKPLGKKQSTQDIIRKINICVEEVAMKRSRQIEADKIRVKQEEFAEYFKNHVGNADVHVYGQLTVNNKAVTNEQLLSDYEVSQLAGKVFQIVSSTPAAVIPLVRANAAFFKAFLEDMEKVRNSFALNASLVSSVENSTSTTGIQRGTASNSSTDIESNILFKCYKCEFCNDVQNVFLVHMKLHEPSTRVAGDSYHESFFSMTVPTETKIDCLDAVTLYRQGSKTSPPAVLWSKRTRQNKRVYSKIKWLHDIYVNSGHDFFVQQHLNVKVSDVGKDR